VSDEKAVISSDEKAVISSDEKAVISSDDKTVVSNNKSAISDIEESPKALKDRRRQRCHKADRLASVYKGQNLVDANVHKKKPGVTIKDLRKTPAREAAHKGKEKEFAFMSQDVDISDMIACEYGLIATITSQLPEEIEKIQTGNAK
jgi:hypothetical protein